MKLNRKFLVLLLVPVALIASGLVLVNQRSTPVALNDAPKLAEPVAPEFEEDIFRTERVSLNYDELRSRIQAKRDKLKAEYDSGRSSTKSVVIRDARNYLFTTLTDSIFPAWYGTPWEFYGDSDIPNVGTIACGYFVSTTLKHIGLPIDRFRIAKMASSNIIKAVCEKSSIKIYPNGISSDSIVTDLLSKGKAMYIVGLDNHVGFLICDSGRVDFCHSSYLRSVNQVCRETALYSSPFVYSEVKYVGRLLDDSFIRSWLSAPVR